MVVFTSHGGGLHQLHHLTCGPSPLRHWQKLTRNNCLGPRTFRGFALAVGRVLPCSNKSHAHSPCVKSGTVSTPALEPLHSPIGTFLWPSADGRAEVPEGAAIWEGTPMLLVWPWHHCDITAGAGPIGSFTTRSQWHHMVVQQLCHQRTSSFQVEGERTELNSFYLFSYILQSHCSSTDMYQNAIQFPSNNRQTRVYLS